MAKNSQGISVQFAGDDLNEVLSVSVDGTSSDTVDVTGRTWPTRDKVFSPADYDYGTVSVTFRDAGNFNVSRVGEVGLLYIDTPGELLSFGAILQSFAWSANVGELQQWTAVFKLGVPSV